MKDDTISRQALLDTVDLLNWYHQNKHGEMVLGANSDEHQAWYKAEDIYKAIESVPTAQPGWIPFLAAYLVMSLMISAISGNLRAWKGEQDG